MDRRIAALALVLASPLVASVAHAGDKCGADKASFVATYAKQGKDAELWAHANATTAKPEVMLGKQTQAIGQVVAGKGQIMKAMETCARYCENAAAACTASKADQKTASELCRKGYEAAESWDGVVGLSINNTQGNNGAAAKQILAQYNKWRDDKKAILPAWEGVCLKLEKAVANAK